MSNSYGTNRGRYLLAVLVTTVQHLHTHPGHPHHFDESLKTFPVSGGSMWSWRRWVRFSTRRFISRLERRLLRAPFSSRDRISDGCVVGFERPHVRSRSSRCGACVLGFRPLRHICYILVWCDTALPYDFLGLTLAGLWHEHHTSIHFSVVRARSTQLFHWNSSIPQRISVHVQESCSALVVHIVSRLEIFHLVLGRSFVEEFSFDYSSWPTLPFYAFQHFLSAFAVLVVAFALTLDCG